jgi:hypothetical protein
MYAPVQPRMTCLNRDRLASSLRARAAYIIALGVLSAACTDAPARPASAPAPANVSSDRPGSSAAPKALTMPPSGGRRIGAPHSDNYQIKPIEGSPESARNAERFVPSSGRAPVRVVAAPTAKPAEPPANGFLGKSEAATLDGLRSGQLQSAEKGTSGRTLAFKVSLDSGVQGYYKPEQRLAGASWAAEVAAFYLDRALQIDRVPPVVSKRLPWKELAPVAAGDPRAKTVVVAKDGSVRGALIAWLPEKLEPAQTPSGWEDWIRSEPLDAFAVSPFQPAAAYKRASAEQRRHRNGGSASAVGTRPAPTPARPELPAELSDLILFDYLTGNAERFAADNSNLLTLGDQGPLIFLDNGSAFAVAPAQRSLVGAQLATVSKFRRRTIDALRALDIEALKATLAADPLGPILDAAAWRGLEARRTAVLDHVARQAKQFGDAVYAW